MSEAPSLGLVYEKVSWGQAMILEQGAELGRENEPRALVASCKLRKGLGEKAEHGGICVTNPSA